MVDNHPHYWSFCWIILHITRLSTAWSKECIEFWKHPSNLSPIFKIGSTVSRWFCLVYELRLDITSTWKIHNSHWQSNLSAPPQDDDAGTPTYPSEEVQETPINGGQFIRLHQCLRAQTTSATLQRLLSNSLPSSTRFWDQTTVTSRVHKASAYPAQYPVASKFPSSASQALRQKLLIPRFVHLPSPVR